MNWHWVLRYLQTFKISENLDIPAPDKNYKEVLFPKLISCFPEEKLSLQTDRLTTAVFNLFLLLIAIPKST